jgi:hypothetical protein
MAYVLTMLYLGLCFGALLRLRVRVSVFARAPFLTKQADQIYEIWFQFILIQADPQLCTSSSSDCSETLHCADM